MTVNLINTRIATKHGCRLKCQDAAPELSTVFLVGNGYYLYACVAKGAPVPLNSGWEGSTNNYKPLQETEMG